MREYRGTLTAAGQRTAPTATAAWRKTSTCSARMKAGEFPDGRHVLRAKIDMASPNMIMRDPTLYRILRTSSSPHGRQVVHLSHVRLRSIPLQDAIEGITHSLCSLEYEIHRPLYDWVVAQAGFDRIRRARSSLRA